VWPSACRRIFIEVYLQVAQQESSAMRFSSKPIVEHAEVPLADAGRWEEIVASWAEKHTKPSQEDGKNNCYVVSVGAWEEEYQQAAQVAEILSLVTAVGDHVVGHEAHRRSRPDPRTYLGSGSSKEIGERAREAGADLLVIDAQLSPSQTRNLEDRTGLAICDREAVILNVFLGHAKTKRARIQVEIAHLQYLRPRIRGIGLDMDQQAGGLMNARGPGETASELLARRLDGRLAELRRQNARFTRAAANQRKNRDGCIRIALVGYTNAGKTSLMNGLTQAGLSARDQPFETLDTTSRALSRHGTDVVISDTVGFIRRLPARLLASFESTLAEAREASLLALVVDAADPEWEMHLQTSEALLAQLGAGDIPRFYVFNKVDLVQGPPPTTRYAAHCEGYPFRVLSSRDPRALSQLKQALIQHASPDHQTRELCLAYHASDLISSVYAQCRVTKAQATPEGLVLTISGPGHLLAGLARRAEEALAEAI